MNLSVKCGEIIVIIGENCLGKFLLVKFLVGVLFVDVGEIEINMYKYLVKY